MNLSTNKSWNPVLNLVSELKALFINECSDKDLWDFGDFNNCIMYWADNVSNDKYKNIFSPLIIKQFKHLVLIKYSLLDTTPNFWYDYDKLYRECRSVVIDLDNDTLVLTPFKKFFNMNEIDETQEFRIRNLINNAKNVEISDKMDGSMISVRNYNGQLILSSSGSLSRETSMHCELGYRLLTQEDTKMVMENPNLTFVFEMISPKDTHVVTYPKDKEGLYLIGIRNVLNGYESPYSEVLAFADKYNVKHTVVFNKTFDDVLSELDDKRSNEAEGFVLNIDGYKLKLKYNDYVSVHKMLSKWISTNTVIKSIYEGTWDDLKSKLPVAYRAQGEEIADKVFLYMRNMNKLIEEAYMDTKKNYKHSSDEKEDRRNYFMYINANHKPFISYLLAIYNSKEYSFLRSGSGKFMKYYEIENEIKRRNFE